MAQPSRRAPRLHMTITLDMECRALLHALAEAANTNQSALLEQLIRARAKRQRITLPTVAPATA